MKIAGYFLIIYICTILVCFNSTIAHPWQLANVVLFFVEHLPEDGRQRLKHVGGLWYD
jgi:hypothetical protein